MMSEFEDLEADALAAIFDYEISEAEREAHEMNDARENRVFGIWFGGHGSYAESENPRDVEVWESDEAARDSLMDRYANGHWREDTFNYVNKSRDEVRTPAVGEDSRIDVYLVDPSGEYDYEPDYVLVLHFDGVDNASVVREG